MIEHIFGRKKIETEGKKYQKEIGGKALSSTKELSNYSFTPATLSDNFLHFAQMSLSLNSEKTKKAKAPFPKLSP